MHIQENLFNHSAEQSVIGSMLEDNSVINKVCRTVTKRKFKHYAHAAIFEAIVEVFHASGVADVITVDEYLTKSGMSQDVGGIAYLADLIKNNPTSRNVMSYAEIVDDKYRMREAQSLCHKMLSGDITYQEYLDRAKELAPVRAGDDIQITWGSEGFDDEQDYLVDGVIPTEAFGVIYGASESFKSFLTIEQACCISAGVKWNGRATERGPVVYVAAEGQRGVARRIKAWEDKTGLTADVAVISQPVYLDQAGEPTKLINIIKKIEELRGLKVKMVVVDTLARCMSGDENSATEMSAFVAGCDRIKNEAKVSIAVVHHSGKDAEKGARGSTALRGACDFEFRVTRDVENGEMAFTVSCTKQKDGERMLPVEFLMTEVDLGIKDKYGKAITSLSVSREGKTPIDRRPDGKSSKHSDSAWLIDQIRAACDGRLNFKIDEVPIRNDFYTYKGNSVKQGTKQKQYKRAIEILIKDGLIDVRETDCIVNIGIK